MRPRGPEALQISRTISNRDKKTAYPKLLKNFADLALDQPHCVCSLNDFTHEPCSLPFGVNEFQNAGCFPGCNNQRHANAHVEYLVQLSFSDATPRLKQLKN